MKKTLKLFVLIVLVCSSARAESVFEQVEELKNAMQKLQKIQGGATWRDGEDWFFNISKNGENIYNVQKIRIHPKKGLTDLPIIETYSANVNSNGEIPSGKIDAFMFPLDVSMNQYLDQGVVSRDRGGILGAAVGTVPENCTGASSDIKQLENMDANVFPKFFEWQKIAKEKNVPPFIKYFDGRKFYDSWDPQRGMTNIIEARGGGEEVDKKKYQVLKENMIKEFNIEINSIVNNKWDNIDLIEREHIRNKHESVKSAAYDLSNRPQDHEISENLNKAISNERKELEVQIYNEAKRKGIVKDVPFVAAETARNPDYEQTGWVFIWKNGNAYAALIQGESNYNAVNLFSKSANKNDENIANFEGTIIGDVEISIYQKMFNFYQAVKRESPKYIAEFVSQENQQTSQQDALFK